MTGKIAKTARNHQKKFKEDKKQKNFQKI